MTLRLPDGRWAIQEVQVLQFYFGAKVRSPGRTAPLIGRHLMRGGRTQDSIAALCNRLLMLPPEEEITVAEASRGWGHAAGWSGTGTPACGPGGRRNPREGRISRASLDFRTRAKWNRQTFHTRRFLRQIVWWMQPVGDPTATRWRNSTGLWVNASKRRDPRGSIGACRGAPPATKGPWLLIHPQEGAAGWLRDGRAGTWEGDAGFCHRMLPWHRPCGPFQHPRGFAPGYSPDAPSPCRSPVAGRLHRGGLAFERCTAPGNAPTRTSELQLVAPMKTCGFGGLPLGILRGCPGAAQLDPSVGCRIRRMWFGGP